MINVIKFNKSIYQILHLEWSSAEHKLGEWLEGSPAEGDLLVISSLSVSQQCALIAKRANTTLECTKYNQLAKRGDYPPSALSQSYCECCVQFQAPQFKRNVKVIECVQRKATNW